MNLLIITGEQSGSQHSAKFVAKMPTDFQFFGTGGADLADQGVNLIDNINNMSCIGMTGVFEKFLYLRRLQTKIINIAREQDVKLAILVDYSGFNLSLAKKLKANNIRVLYFITPKFWAWGKHRLNKLKRYADHSAVILPFEAKLLTEAGITATYVGNPSLANTYKREKPKELTLGLIPGSRACEVKRLLALFINASRIVKHNVAVKVLLSKSPNLGDEFYAALPDFIELRSNAISVMQESSTILIASGTATLEAALIGVPMVISYKTDWLSGFIFKICARTKYVGLPNILLGNEVAPEVLQENANPENLADSILAVMNNMKYQEQEFAKIHKLLCTKENFAHNLVSLVLKELTLGRK